MAWLERLAQLLELLAIELLDHQIEEEDEAVWELNKRLVELWVEGLDVCGLNVEVGRAILS